MADDVQLAYVRDESGPLLMRSVVAFVDLLGTSVHANEDSAQETLTNLDAALRRARDQSGVDEELTWFHTSWFSDNLSICAPLPQPQHSDDRAFEESSLGLVLNTLMWIQFGLALDGIVLRGGVTVGRQFADDEVNFGPALVEAVALERGANYPRVVVDERTLGVVDDHYRDHCTLSENPFHHTLMRGADGTVFLSYLAAALEAYDEEEALGLLDRHRSAIAALRSAHQASPEAVVEKYEWLARYHNTFCNTFFHDSADIVLPDIAPDAGLVPYVPEGAPEPECPGSGVAG